MTGTILRLTQQPVTQNTFSFGGDDTHLGRTGFFGTVVEWDRTAQQDCFKANFVFLVKKMFAFLDGIGIGTCFYGITGFTGQLNACEMYQIGLKLNQHAREKIIAALGGEAVCAAIPVVQIQASDFTDYLKLGDQYFHRGQSMVQGEDPAGRKFVLLRLADRTGRIVTATIHQRYRETCISVWSGGGSLWTSNLSDDGYSVNVGTNNAVEFIQKLRTHQHRDLSLTPKV